MKFYKCQKCGKIIGMIKNSPCDTFCCGEPMVAMEANTTDAAVEKHVPAVSCEGNIVTARVGEVDHPMTEEHFIEWVALETKEGMQRKELAPGDTPCVAFAVVEGDAPVAAYAYCNLHGLWKKEL